MKNFIRNSSQKSQRSQKCLKIFNTIDLFIKDPLPSGVNILEVIREVEKRVPFHLTSEIDVFYVGNFKEFQEKQVNAMYRDGAVYVTNDQDDVMDMVDDIVHEIAHATEHIYVQVIYSDGRLQEEFFGKRKRLEGMIREYGYLDGRKVSFANLEYSKELDDYLYKDLGYDKLETFCSGLFIRPYAVTDIREYFATALEEYLIGDPKYMRRICPVAYEKIHYLCKSGV